MEKMDLLAGSCCNLEESILTLDASITSFKDLSISETNDSGLSLEKIITDSEDDPELEEAEISEKCEDFHCLGYCLKGANCCYDHRTTRKQTSRSGNSKIISTILSNFPEIIMAGSLKRTRSFLE
jgi:hypothetical protein